MSNYKRKIRRLGKKLQSKGAFGVHHVDVLHDDWCDFLNDKGSCNCNPMVKLQSGRE